MSGCVTAEKLINLIDYKKALRIAYNDKCSTILHTRKLQYKVKESYFFGFYGLVFLVVH